jgi:TRAP-type C4-dicarboxylate transport system permease small subunit
MGEKIKRFFYSIDDIVGAVSLIAIICITVSAVFMRYVMNSPFTWTEEVSLALFVWFVFIGISAVTKRDSHIGIDYFVLKLPKPMQKVMSAFRFLMVLIAFLFLVVLGWRLAIESQGKITSVLRIPYFYIDIAVSVGGIMSIIHFIRLSIINKRKREEG